MALSIPPSFTKNVIVYGLHGGAQWPGAIILSI